MKKIISFSAAFLASLFSYSQNIVVPKYALVSLPANTKGITITNLGVIHKKVFDGGIVYSDTTLANTYFRLLAKEVDPKKVVLVVEYPTFKSVDIIRNDNSIWITSSMAQLGFTKWIAADTRTDSDSLYFGSMRYLTDVANTYFHAEMIRDSVDYFGSPAIFMRQKIAIPDKVEDTILKCITVSATDIIFETNIKRICQLLKLNGYIPVVVTGMLHILALNEPCIIQVPNLRYQAEEFVRDELNSMNARHFLIKFFLRRHNLILVPKN